MALAMKRGIEMQYACFRRDGRLRQLRHEVEIKEKTTEFHGPERQLRHLVLRMRRAYSCWSILCDLAEQLEKTGGRFYLCGIKPDIQPIIQHAGMQRVLPPERIFPATDSPIEAFDRCLCAISPSNTSDVSRFTHWRQRSFPSNHGASGRV